MHQLHTNVLETTRPREGNLHVNHRTHIGRWIAAGASALTLAGAGAGIAAASSAPPSSPPVGSAPADSGAGGTTGAGPSDCAAVPASEATEGSAAPGNSAGPAAPATDAPLGTDAAAPAGSDAATAESAAPTDLVAESVPAGSAAAVAGPFVQIEETEEYGPVLVDHDCRTLYAFTKDLPGAPSCVEACAQAWPALSVTDAAVPALADELDPTLFSIVEHPESGPMLQVGDWPLYYFASDLAPGDLNGQGVGGVWWLVAPDGTLVEEAGGSTEPAGSDAGGAAASMPTDTMGSGTMVPGTDDGY